MRLHFSALLPVILLSLTAAFLSLKADAKASKSVPSVSVYTMRPDDQEAFYFDLPGYNDGKKDATEALQNLIFKVKREKNFGILFLPEGRYLVSGTLQLPSSVRLVGYGKKRPVLVLAPGTFTNERNPMLWFTGGIAEDGGTPPDANPGTFYSAVSNVDFEIGKDNPEAVAIRFHAAQHCFVNHCDIHMGGALAGFWDVGNEIEDVRFFGGKWGIISGRTSPGWPMLLADTYFEGQSEGAIYSKETGFAILGMQVKNTPVAVEMEKNLQDRLYVENALFENVSEAAIRIGLESNTFSQVNISDVSCSNVPVFAEYLQSGRKLTGEGKTYKVPKFTYGFVYDDMASQPRFEETFESEPLSAVPKLSRVAPSLPDMSEWVNVRDFGAKGDNVTDDTEAFEKALASSDVIYVPQGWYRIKRTLKFRERTKLIGLHPFGTQFRLSESEPAFSGFGSPVPMIESFKGGDNVLNGIGIFAGAYNYRAVGCKWISGESSYLNDVKFVGQHGTLYKPAPGRTSLKRDYNSRRRFSTPDNPVYTRGKDVAWDTQYWSLWITDGAGGTIKDVWSADTYAAAGVYISNTSTPGRIMAMSLEHHVRGELILNQVSNWKLYALQFEEEGVEGEDEHNVEMSLCDNLEFNNVWMYRVIRAYKPKDIGFRVWDCKNLVFRNMHNYTQILPVIEYPVYDMNKAIPVSSWDFASLTITGNEKSLRPEISSDLPREVVRGFEIAAGAVSDSKGNVYFCENRMKKIYRIDAQTGAVTLLSDCPFRPIALQTDTEDNLLVIARYDPQPGLIVGGRQEEAVVLPDDNPMYSGWGNGGWEAKAYAIDPDVPDSFIEMKLVETSSVKDAKKVIWPSSRWRDDFVKIAERMPDESFVAPDGKTVIPRTYDLYRCSAMFAVEPGRSGYAYVCNEMDKTTVRFKVNSDGSLTKDKVIAPFAQYCDVIGPDGHIYVADGQIYVIDCDGDEIRRVPLPERPISLAFGGESFNKLYITTSRAVYVVDAIAAEI